MATEKVLIPDIGDAGDVEVIEVLVAVGDAVAVDDPLIVIESDKASMEVPSTVAGRITAVNVKVGDRCAEGDAVVAVETEAETEAETGADDAADDAEPARKEAQEEKEAEVDAPAATAAADRAPAESTGAANGAASDTRIEDVTVPDVGEAGDVAVIEIMVAPGDRVEVDDGLVVLESDKATMEVPSTVAGTVVSVEVKEGDPVADGTLVARIEVQGASAASSASAGSPQPGPSPESAPFKKSTQASESSPSAGSGSPATGDAPAADGVPSSGADVYAGPAVRRLARELGVQLTDVSGSGPRGRILKEDVQGHVKQVMQSARAGAVPASGSAAVGGGIPSIPVVDFSRFGEIEQQPLSRIMKAGAANLHRSWLNLPHVTQHDDADVTELEAFRKSLKPDAERAGVKVTPLPLLMKVMAAALREFPRFNGSFAGDGEHYVLKKYVHIGFAVDTPDGLLVPVVRDVDRKGVFELAGEIADLSERARSMKLKPDEMRGGCFSISSLGAIGGRGFTPIVNAPEVAILGVSRLETRPVWDGEGFVPRELLPLSLSYDHRAINGAEAGRFLTWTVQALGDIRRLLI